MPEQFVTGPVRTAGENCSALRARLNSCLITRMDSSHTGLDSSFNSRLDSNVNAGLDSSSVVPVPLPTQDPN